VQTDPGKYFCSEGGVCVEPTGGSSARSMELPSPTLELIGQTTVYINQGDTYLKCPPQPPLDVVCDAGARASDPVEGDISKQVRMRTMKMTSLLSATWDAGILRDYAMSFRLESLH
jgi:hypothetical protein